MVQMEMTRRSNKRVTSDFSITGKGKYSGKCALTDMLVCGECGSSYRRRTWAKNGKSKKVWRCLSRLEHGPTISVEETKLNDAIHRAMRTVTEQKESLNLILSELSYAATGDDKVLDVSAIEQEIQTLGATSKSYIAIMASTEGGKERYRTEIVNINQKSPCYAMNLKRIKAVIEASEEVNTENRAIEKLVQEHGRYV